MAYRGRKQEDSKYVRLTGLWQNKKKDNLWTGKMRGEDLEKAIEKMQEAVDAGVDIVAFLWENDKRGQKDPDFTIQIAVSEEEGGRSSGRNRHGRSSGRDREDARDEDRDRDRDEEGEPEKEEDEPKENARRSKAKSEPEPAPRGRSKSSSKSSKDDNW